MKVSHLFFASFSALLLLSGCAAETQTQATPLELQALQQQDFETSKEIAFASVMSVFQDLGYTIQGADKDTGFITAFSATQSKQDWIFTGSKFDTNTRATAFVEKVTEKTSRIRLNFVTSTKESSTWGQESSKDVPILDPKVYEAAFNRIGDAIFTRAGAKG